MKDITTITTQGFVSFEYPEDLRAAVENAVTHWKRFCDLPQEVKDNLPYSNDSDGVGYESKDGSGPKGDRKENFDITLAGKEWLRRNAGKIDDQVALDFIQSVVPLARLITPVALSFADVSEDTYGIDGLVSEVGRSVDRFFIRFIHYSGDREVGEETAVAHTDQSGFTLHLFESDPGLQSLNAEKKWIDMPVSQGETAIIPSMQFQLRSEGKVNATCHRVVATEKTAQSGRYSAVCFVQFADTKKYDKHSHGRLQEKKPGFNYGMPHAEFEKLFK